MNAGLVIIILLLGLAILGFPIYMALAIGTVVAINMAGLPIMATRATARDFAKVSEQIPQARYYEAARIIAVLPEEGLKSFDKASLMSVADKVSAEIVIAMRITEVKELPKSFMREPAVVCIMKGELATFNRLTGKYYYKKINYNEQMEEVLTVRTDWQQNAFADFLRRGIISSLAPSLMALQISLRQFLTYYFKIVP